jgi:hypothetical protein
MYLVISKCVTAVKVSNFSGHDLRNRSTLVIGLLDYIGILYPHEHPPEVCHIPSVRVRVRVRVCGEGGKGVKDKNVSSKCTHRQMARL